MNHRTTVDQMSGRSPRATVAIAVGIVVALLLGWFLAVAPLLAGDDSREPAFAQTPTPTATATEPDDAASPPIGEAEEAEQLPIETYEVFLSRDPFEPIRPEADNGGDGGGTTGTTTTTTTTGDGDGTTTGDGDGDDTTTGDGDGGTTGDVGPPLGDDDDDGGDSEQVDGREVVLIDVFEENGQERVVVEVDGTAYEVGEGDEFAENFRVLSIDPPCATFLHGDDAFTLCEGERVLK